VTNQLRIEQLSLKIRKLINVEQTMMGYMELLNYEKAIEGSKIAQRILHEIATEMALMLTEE
jgi:hypothetical protein